MPRIHFKSQRGCSEFFKEVRKSLKIDSWRKLAKLIGTSRSMMDKYRKRKLCMPEERFNILLPQLTLNAQRFFLDNIEKKEDNWGQIVGGKKAYKLNKKHFDVGRRKANRLRSLQVRYNFDINMPLSEELCEFVGAIIGDGFTNKYNTIYQTQISGDAKLDYAYYHTRLKPICKNLFDISPKIYIRDNVLRFNIYSKRLFELLTKRFNIPAGKKCYTVSIPPEILNAKARFISVVLRGMFDTDGGISFDKRDRYKEPYVRINYTSASKKLVDQVHNILIKYSIKHSIHKRGTVFMIQINGVQNVREFLINVGFSNERHLKKIKYLL